MTFKAPYWMNPIVIMVAWMVMCVIASLMDNSFYRQFMRASKFIELKHVLIYFLATLIFCVFCYFGMHRAASAPNRSRNRLEALTAGINSTAVARLVLGAFVVVTIAYLIWFFPTFDGRVVSRLIEGESTSAMRAYGNQISGITTLTQLGIPLAVVSVFGILLGKTRHRRHFYRLVLAAVIFFALYRMLLWSERLALFEILVPAMIAWTLVVYRGQAIYRWLPVVAFFGAVFIFGLSEYFRSWNFYADRSSGIVSFSFLRFISYYLSSMNNMALLIDRIDPSYLPLNTLQFVFKMPLPGFAGLNELQGSFWQETYMGSLESYANPEFNLFGAVGLIISDFGVVGGILVMSVFGWITGRLYASAQSGMLFGLVIYPIWMVGLLEFGRLLYWGNGRAFPAWLLAFALVYVLRRAWLLHARRVRRPRAEPADRSVAGNSFDRVGAQ